MGGGDSAHRKWPLPPRRLPPFRQLRARLIVSHARTLRAVVTRATPYAHLIGPNLLQLQLTSSLWLPVSLSATEHLHRMPAGALFTTRQFAARTSWSVEHGLTSQERCPPPPLPLRAPGRCNCEWPGAPAMRGAALEHRMASGLRLYRRCQVRWHATRSAAPPCPSTAAAAPAEAAQVGTHERGMR